MLQSDIMIIVVMKDLIDGNVVGGTYHTICTLFDRNMLLWFTRVSHFYEQHDFDSILHSPLAYLKD